MQKTTASCAGILVQTLARRASTLTSTSLSSMTLGLTSTSPFTSSKREKMSSVVWNTSLGPGSSRSLLLGYRSARRAILVVSTYAEQEDTKEFKNLETKLEALDHHISTLEKSLSKHFHKIKKIWGYSIPTVDNDTYGLALANNHSHDMNPSPSLRNNPSQNFAKK